jgi:anaphase-promoting complex subunit 8
LIPADPHEITINLKLARLHRLLEEPAEAVGYHRKVVEVCQADRLSQIISAFLMFIANPVNLYVSVILVRPIADYAKSSLEVAEYHMRIPGGDLALAKDYLEQVAGSNAEDVARASELLKSVIAAIQAKALKEDEERARVAASAAMESTGVEMATE